MSEAQRIVALGRRARARGEQLCLATVVQVEGSAYRKPGARMLLTSGGERAGTISGGCLESEVSRKAWWLTASGARLERYSSFADEDGGMPYGLGCGGTVSLLLEQGPPVLAVLDALERVLTARQPAVVIMALTHGPAAAVGGQLESQRPGTLAVLTLRGQTGHAAIEIHYLDPANRRDLDANAEGLCGQLLRAVENVFAQQRSCWLSRHLLPLPPSQLEPEAAYLLEYLAPPPSITIFGAGDDAQPIAELAHTLGWRVTVADGRAHLARRERFPLADEVRVLDYENTALRAACGMAHHGEPGDAPGCESRTPAGSKEIAGLLSGEIAVILTHSYEQDRALLTALLPRQLRYLGILGPRHRTGRLLTEVAPLLGLSIAQAFERLHSPIGLDIGAGDPASVALAIVSQIQAVLHGRRVTIERAEPAGPAEQTVEQAGPISPSAPTTEAAQIRAPHPSSATRPSEPVPEPALEPQPQRV